MFRGLVFGADASDKWTDSYLNKEYGNLEIKVTERKQRYDRIEEKKHQMKLNAFLRSFRSDDLYLKTIMPSEMMHEMPMPHLVNCGVYSQTLTNLNTEKLSLLNENKNKFAMPKLAQLVEPYLWMSAGDTSSLIHSHPEHNLHCVLDGRKDFILIPSDQFRTRPNWKTLIDLNETYPNSNEWYSKIDVDKVNVFKYKLLNTLVWYWATLRSGDCIFIPDDYLHQIRSHGRSVSTSVYFSELKHDLDAGLLKQIKEKLFAECPKDAPLFEPAEMRESNFIWKYSHSERHLVKKTYDESEAKHLLFCLIHNDNFLYFERFDHFYKEITSELKENIDKFNLNEREMIQLNSTDIWDDLNETSELISQFKLAKSSIYNLNNLKRFINILNLSCSYHDLVKGREEL